MAVIQSPELRIGKRVADLFATSIVWDNHTCPSISLDNDKYLSILRRHRMAGVDVVSVSVGFDGTPWQNTVLLLATFRRWVREQQEDYALVGTADEIDTARRAGKLGVVFDIEGGKTLNGSISMVELYYDLGVRWLSFAYNRNNELGGGCQDDDRGLTDFGRAVLREMNRVGMVVCCSHLGQRSAIEIMELSDSPVIFSHSNPKALCDHPRCIGDDAIKACAATGGVVGINGIGIFLGDNDNRTETIVRHIEYVANLVGTDHVGIALDYVFDTDELDSFIRANPELYPPEKYGSGIRMLRPEQIPAIADELFVKGFSESDVKKVLGGNHLRIARQVWKPARRLDA